MRDEIEKNPKLLVIVLGTGMVAVIIFAIFMLVLVWSPKPRVDANNNDNIRTGYELGKYSMLYVAENTVISDYCKNILNTFTSEDMNLIGNIILPEYLTFRNIDSSRLNVALNQKGVLGKRLQFTDYKVTNHPRYGKIFEVNIQSIDNTYSDKMLVIEKSPNDYKVSFDGFVGLDRTKRSYTIDGLRLDITEIKELATLVSIKFTLTNVSGRDIIINRDNNYETVYLNLTSGSEIRLNSTWLSGDTKQLTNGYTVNLNSEFVTGGLSSGIAKSIVIKNIYDTVSRETKDIVFPIN